MPNRWWEKDPRECYWFETTDRDDFGTDLNAPVLGEKGTPHWSYEFVTEVRAGDVVVHYRTRPTKTIVGWSRAVGSPYQDEVLWGAHGHASGRGPVSPYERPGWRIGLDGPYHLDHPITLEQLRGYEPELKEIKENLEREVGKPIYFPFAFSPSRPLRTTQFYLTKAPRALLLAVPELAQVESLARHTDTLASRSAPGVVADELGDEYRIADEAAGGSERDPFSIDPAVVERGIRGHRTAQNSLASFVERRGCQPRSPSPGEPQYDLAWHVDGTTFVAEVKSTTAKNEEKQLRLGLGQVLRYAHQLESGGPPVHRILVAERQPVDRSWVELGRSLDVLVTWPPDFPGLDI